MPTLVSVLSIESVRLLAYENAFTDRCKLANRTNQLGLCLPRHGLLFQRSQVEVYDQLIYGELLSCRRETMFRCFNI
jgi:hypothetical protein